MYERVWKVKCSHNGFTYCVMLRTTEQKLQGYMKTELPEAVSYIMATEAEELAAMILGLPIYFYS